MLEVKVFAGSEHFTAVTSPLSRWPLLRSASVSQLAVACAGAEIGSRIVVTWCPVRWRICVYHTRSESACGGDAMSIGGAVGVLIRRTFNQS